ncbi:P-loop containing nucleoside triphosphate hydrolase protein [Rhodotorula sp. JG-1b]|nr:P-loop containing nucleoside triphosphate hydrolase protein [Rhodotorula sp. JG-1b]
MLDHFAILTQGGLVLWQRSFTPAPAPFDALIREALIEQRTSSSSSSDTAQVSRWDKDAHSVLWLLANDLDLVFCVAYQRILALPYIPDLLHAVRTAFLDRYGGAVRNIVDSTSGKAIASSSEAWNRGFKGWDDTFNRILREHEASSAKSPTNAFLCPAPAPREAGDGESSGAVDAQAIARNIAALKARQKAAAKSGSGSKTGRKSLAGTESEGGSESDATTPTRSRRKVATKWGDSPLTESDLAVYDYSSDSIAPGTPQRSEMDQDVDTSELVAKGALGRRDQKSGLYEVADYRVGAGGGDDSESEEDEGDEDQDQKPASSTAAAAAASSGGALSSFFSKLSLSSRDRALTVEDLAPTIAAMQQHLMAKNVARDIAEQIVANVGKSLEGKKIALGGGLLGIGGGDRAGKKAVRDAMQEALVKILTPKTSTDLLLEIQRKRSSSTAGGGDPYAITFVGVNGVGKSTNLSKVAFWLLQNRLRVLIAACDTFRSGAVEQLRVHVRNLSKLEEELGGGMQDGKSRVELFEKGYGKDAAGIAKDAIAHAKQNGFDVVLIDTAGRMQDNEPLMRALAKLIAVNQPDKIIFVGEALVGNEAVDQLTKFNRSLRDFSARGSAGSGAGKGKGEGRGVDGMILTKFDTIDDKVGAALSMTYVTGQPIYFVGTGQTYSDLRMLRVNHIVQALLQN